MGQFLLQHLLEEKGYTVTDDPEGTADFCVDSAATSREEIGNPTDSRTVRKLKEHGISCGKHYARQIRKSDYEIYDLIIIMDSENEWGIRRILGNGPLEKVHYMLEYAEGEAFCSRDGYVRDVSDPWYTHDFEKTYQDLYAGCSGLLKQLIPPATGDRGH